MGAWDQGCGPEVIVVLLSLREHRFGKDKLWGLKETLAVGVLRQQLLEVYSTANRVMEIQILLLGAPSPVPRPPSC